MSPDWRDRQTRCHPNGATNPPLAGQSRDSTARHHSASPPRPLLQSFSNQGAGIKAPATAIYNGAMPSPATPPSIGLNTLAMLTGLSVRTWQRRIEQGLVPRAGDGRALVPFDVVQPLLAVALSPEDVQMLVRADAGDAAAQADIGALFALAALEQSRCPLMLADESGGGGNVCRRRFIFLSRPRSRTRPMPCTGWAHCMLRACAATMVMRWQRCGWPRRRRTGM